jgi:hypothetical protein
MDDITTASVGVGGSLTGIIIYVLFKYCYKKELHTKCRSACCEASVDVEDNSSPIK